MRTDFHYLIAISAMTALMCTACTNSDDKEDSVNQSYFIKLASVQLYDENRYSAPDSLICFITSNMGIEKDTAANSWMVNGSSLEACDKELVSRFDKACSMVNPELYDGKYKVWAFRKNSDGQSVVIANREFTATAVNNGQGDIDRTIRPKVAGQYIYDVAIASGNNWEYTHKCLQDSDYVVIEGDLNQKAGGKYIYVGVKYTTANDPTKIKGTVINDYTGEMETRFLTAKEAAISNLVCIQNGGHPQSFKGPVNTLYSAAVFERFRQLGDSNGDTNQGAGGADSFLYFTRDNNESQYIEQMFFVAEEYTSYWIFGHSGDGSNLSELIKQASYDKGKGRCSSFGGNADLNKGTGAYFTYLGYYTVNVKQN